MDLPDWAAEWASSLVSEPLQSCTSANTNEVNSVYRLSFDSGAYFLKVGPNLGPEYERLLWLHGRAPCPHPLGFTTYGADDALITTAVNGIDLAKLSQSLPPATIVSRLAAALRSLHRIPATDWPFGGNTTGKVLVHGDACLPNFVYEGDRLSGYIDLGGLDLDEPEIDLAAAVWSLQYNLGEGHGRAFLQAYGLNEVQEGYVEYLARLYESR